MLLIERYIDRTQDYSCRKNGLTVANEGLGKVREMNYASTEESV